MTIGYINYYSPTRTFRADLYSTTGYECDALEAFTSAVEQGRCASLRVTGATRRAAARAEDTVLVETVRFMLLRLDQEVRRVRRHADEYWEAASRLD